MSYRYDQEAIERAARVAATGDPLDRLHDLDAHPKLDEAADTIADGTAAVVIQQSAVVLTALMQNVADAGDDGVDITPGLTNIGEQVKQACGAAFLRGVLLGHALAINEGAT